MQANQTEETMGDKEKSAITEMAVLNEKMNTFQATMTKVAGQVEALVTSSQTASVQAGVTQEKVDGLTRSIEGINNRLQDGDTRIVRMEQTIGQHALIWKLVGGAVFIVGGVVGWGFNRFETLGRADTELRAETSAAVSSIDRRLSIVEVRQGAIPGGETRNMKGQR